MGTPHVPLAEQPGDRLSLPGSCGFSCVARRFVAGKMGFVDIVERMRSDWNRRAKEDAYFYAAFARRRQTDQEFFASAADTIPTLEKELSRLPESPVSERRALEIGCGPGRLM